VHATAREPSIFKTSLLSSTSTSSSKGTLLSRATVPAPLKQRLKSPSPPARAELTLLRETTLRWTVLSQARNIPSSTARPPCQEETSCKIIYLYVGSKTKIPLPTYSGLTADSFVTAPLTILPKKSPTPLTP